MKSDYIFMQKKEGIHLIPNAYIIANVYCDSMKQATGKSFGPTLVAYKNFIMYWYASESSFADAAKQALQKAKENQNYLGKAIKIYQLKIKQLNKFTANIFKSSLNKKSNLELLSLFNKYMKLYQTAYLWSEPIVLGLEKSLGQYLQTYLKNKLKNDENAAMIFSLLSSPHKKTFAKEEEDELLLLAIKIKNNKNYNANKAISNHTKKYCWIPYDYGLELWNEKYFTFILDKILKQNDMEKRLTKSNNYFKNLPRQQKLAEKKNSLDQKHANLFKILRQAAYLLDYKKKMFTIIHFQITKLIQEIAKRLNQENYLIQYYLPQELEIALKKNKKIPEEFLIKRGENSLCIFENSKVKLLTGQEAETYLSHHLNKEKKKNTIITGVTASAGMYTGKARLLKNANEIPFMKEGEILITASTNPEFIPAMRLAGAIVTDQGGIMCHAAIISRELGVPCVVGTKNASTFFKNGDVIEVNANHGVIKIKN